MPRKTIQRKHKGKTRKSITRSKYGGWPSLGMFSTKPQTVEPKEVVSTTGLAGDQEQLQHLIDNAYTATAVSSAVISKLTVSGVGIPLAALLAGALLIANKMFDLMRSNLKLRLLMHDAIVIIMDCYLVFSLIKKSYDVIGLYDDPYNDCMLDNEQKINDKMRPKSMDSNQLQQLMSKAKQFMDHREGMDGGERTRKYQINQIMEAQLKYQIEKLINVLMHLMETDTLNMLMTDSTLKDNAFGKLLQSEDAKRKREAGVIGYFSKSKMTRNYDRRFGGEHYVNEINKILTVLNSYIMLLKSNLDTVFKKFEILTPEVYKVMWVAILCSSEYNHYIKPVIADVLKEAQQDAKEIGANDLITSMALVGKVDDQKNV